jgi:hypothetical protein
MTLLSLRRRRSGGVVALAVGAGAFRYRSAERFRGQDHGDLRGSVICFSHSLALDAMVETVLHAWRVPLHHVVTEVQERGGAE